MNNTKIPKTGRHFLQIPGPSNIPDRILRAIDQPIIDHRGPDFAELTLNLLDRLKKVFKTTGHVVIYPSSGSGAWEAALVNTLSPREKILMFETGYFAAQWRKIAERLNLDVDFVPGDWRRGVDPSEVEAKLSEDKKHEIKAVAVVHNETSSGAVSNIKKIRKAMNNAGHPALLMVDVVSSLASLDFQQDNWGVDIAVSASQKGLMLPPGLGFNAISSKAIEASRHAQLSRSYWDWEEILINNSRGFFPYTPATNLLFGLDESLSMLFEEGLKNVFRRHERYAKASQIAVKTWGLELQCINAEEVSNALTAVRLPDGYDADSLRKIILDRFDMSLGTGLSKVKGKVFRIGHLGYFNDLMLAGTLCGVEMGLDLAKIPFNKGGVQDALEFLKKS